MCSTIDHLCWSSTKNICFICSFQTYGQTLTKSFQRTCLACCVFCATNWCMRKWDENVHPDLSYISVPFIFVTVMLLFWFKFTPSFVSNRNVRNEFEERNIFGLFPDFFISLHRVAKHLNWNYWRSWEDITPQHGKSSYSFHIQHREQSFKHCSQNCYTTSFLMGCSWDFVVQLIDSQIKVKKKRKEAVIIFSLLITKVSGSTQI